MFWWLLLVIVALFGVVSLLINRNHKRPEGKHHARPLEAPTAPEPKGKHHKKE